jgi:beta-lactamase class A
MAVSTRSALAGRLDALCDPLPFHVGWYLKDLRGGTEADRNGDVVVPSASTRKVAILMTALAAVRRGELALDGPIPIPPEYHHNDSGVLQHLTPGITLPLRDVLMLMIIVSDTACTATTIDLVTLDGVNAFCTALGMRGTAHRRPMGGKENVTSPRDMGLLLDTITRGAMDPAVASRIGCTPELCAVALDILGRQKLRTRLPSLLPEGTRIAHKTGTGKGVFNDAGIVYAAEEPAFILAAYTNGVPPALPDGTPGFAAAATLIGTLARTAFDDFAR